MRFSIGLPIPGYDTWWEGTHAEIAQEIERVGFDACFVTDHPVPVVDATATGHHTLDPFVLLSFMASATTTLRLHTNCLVLPYRNPFLVAKSAASLDYLSGGRLILGVAAGYLKPEFAALGVDYGERNELVDEALPTMRLAWNGDPMTLTGRHWRADRNSMLPRPASVPHPPIWMGGNSLKAMRRAVTFCQGWSPTLHTPPEAADIHTTGFTSLDELHQRLSRLRDLMEESGRTEPLDICIGPRFAARLPHGSGQQVLEEIESMSAMGVTWLNTRLEATSKAELLERIGAFAELVGRTGVASA